MSVADLDALYRRALYRVDAPGGAIDLRIGERSPALDRLLARHGVTTWGFVTAVNPRSVALAETENRARTDALARRLAATGWTVIAGQGLDPEGRWPAEPSFLVLGAELAALVRLAAELDQAAIVGGEAGGAPRLIWIDRGSSG